jgi:hypothetical protein
VESLKDGGPIREDPMPAPTTFPITTALSVTASETWPADRVYIFGQGGSVSITGGSTLTIQGQLIASREQIFFPDSTSAVRGVAEAMPEWWGATGNGTTDDAPALQAAITCVVQAGVDRGTSMQGRARLILQPSARYLCNSSINIFPGESTSFSMVGAGTLLDGSRLIAGAGFNGTGALLSVVGNVNSSIVDVELSNFGLEYDGGSCTIGLMIQGPYNNLKYGTVKDFYIANFPHLLIRAGRSNLAL